MVSLGHVISGALNQNRRAIHRGRDWQYVGLLTMEAACISNFLSLYFYSFYASSMASSIPKYIFDLKIKGSSIPQEG